MTKGIQRKLKQAIARVGKEIKDHASRGWIAGGLVGEGYAGGYRDALYDVSLVLRGIDPCARPGYWEDAPEHRRPLPSGKGEND